METKDRAKHVAPGEGKALWVAGDLGTLKVVGEDTDGAFALAEDLSLPGGGPPPHVHHPTSTTARTRPSACWRGSTSSWSASAPSGQVLDRWSTARGTSLTPSRTWGPHPPGCSCSSSRPVLRSSSRKWE